jgi:hypothetical protein
MSALDLPAAKRHLNIDVDTYDVELTAMIASAEAILAQEVGPLSTSTVTARVPGYSWGLHLPVYPAVSLTSVTPVGGTALTLGDLYLEKESGAVSYNGTGAFTSAGYDVVYTAGRSPIPDDLVQAVKDQLKHMWKSQRGGASRPGTAPEVLTPISPFAPEVEPVLRRRRLFTIGA